MKFFDITKAVQEAPLYPGSSPVLMEKMSDMGKGDVYNSTLITAGSHIGTHADAYGHFINGEKTIDQLSLEHYFGTCRVITLTADSMIEKEHLINKIDDCKRVAIRGGEKSYLTAGAAKYIVEKGIITVLTEAWSVAPLDNEVEIHTTLLGNHVGIVENIILSGVADGEYFLSAPPIKYKGGDGAPVRAVLIDGLL